MKLAAPQQKRSGGKSTHRRPGPAPQRKAAMGRPYGLNHVAIGPAETGLEAQASHVASMAVRGQRDLGHTLTPAPAAAVAIPSRGMPLPAPQRSWLEPAFGADLAAVRVHHDADSATAARAEHAHAFTAGRDIYFGDGCYEPHGEAGRHLLAHEVAHVLQQTGSTDSARRLKATDSSGAGEVQRAVIKKRRPDEQPLAAEAMHIEDKLRRKP
jgi:Domain of unknown function (DUF4157)